MNASRVSAFRGAALIARGRPGDVWRAVRDELAAGGHGQILVFEDGTAELIDLDPREPPRRSEDAPAAPTGRGRPKLGVVAREVTLLPRHWDWLGAQPGGASAALRRLVDEARRRRRSRADQRRAAQAAAFRFMNAIAGDFPHFEEALRALFADDRERFAAAMKSWPEDVRSYAMALAFPRPSGKRSSGE